MTLTTEIKFKRDTAFRNGFFVPESFSHPAKMDAQLLIWITEKFTNVGETILDPMFGSGTTMLACTLGRNVIGVELEEKFVRMAEKNWQKVRQRPQLGSTMGNCQILQGDARQLEGLLADKIITSPPHGNRLSDDVVADNDPQRMSYRQSLVDKVITSPPYENGTSGPSRSPFWERLANDPTSARFGRQKHPSVGEGYDKVDSVITSPPYENQIHKQDEGHLDIGGGQRKENSQYAQDFTNIGNLKGQTYLDAMLLVYQQCHSVLKPGGLLILVTKNFIRNKTEIRLDSDTIKLCEQVGFTFQERWYRKLAGQSFWRTIYQQKYPDAPVLDKEDVLIFRRLL
jgi:DNA modification methylase